MKNRDAYCSFCRKSYREVGPLVEGSRSAYICGECIELSQSIIKQETRRRLQIDKGGSSSIAHDTVMDKLNQLISGQLEAKKALVDAMGHKAESCARALLVGPAASGILLARALAHALEAPFAAGIASRLAPGQFHDGRLPQIIHRLLIASDFDFESAKGGVVYMGNVDQQQEQRALVGLWREPVVPLGRSEIDTRKVLFVCGGNFTGFDQTIGAAGRHPEQPIVGDDLTAFGAVPDWVRDLRAFARVMPFDDTTWARIASCIDFGRLVVRV